MLENIHWLGHDSFRLDGSVTIYIDPWKLPAGLPKAGLILITHDHYDHFSPPDIESLTGPDTVVAGPPSVTGLVRGCAAVTLGPGDTAEIAGVGVEAVAAYNIDKFRAPGEPFHPPEAGGLGYVVTLDGARYYHAGDTDLTPEMAGVRCDVALLPVGGTYTMTAEEAAAACEVIQAAAAVPMHYGDIVGGVADAERFRELCRIPVTILTPDHG